MRRADIRQLPPVDELRRLFSYDPETGVVVRRVRPHPQAKRSPPGAVATIRNQNGYLFINIDGRGYYAHRIIWKMQTGTEPEDQIDHINGTKTDNRWANLREADNSRNIQNSGLRRDNASGVKGVCWVKSHKAWAAYITVNKKQMRLGRFKSISDAAAARAKAAEALHGEFARAA